MQPTRESRPPRARTRKFSPVEALELGSLERQGVPGRVHMLPRPGGAMHTFPRRGAPSRSERLPKLGAHSARRPPGPNHGEQRRKRARLTTPRQSASHHRAQRVRDPGEQREPRAMFGTNPFCERRARTCRALDFPGGMQRERASPPESSSPDPSCDDQRTVRARSGLEERGAQAVFTGSLAKLLWRAPTLAAREGLVGARRRDRRCGSRRARATAPRWYATRSSGSPCPPCRSSPTRCGTRSGSSAIRGPSRRRASRPKVPFRRGSSTSRPR